jgi:endonuclease G
MALQLKKAFLITSVLIFLQSQVTAAINKTDRTCGADSVLPTLSRAVKSNKNIEIPGLGKQDRPLFHTGFSLIFDERHKQARWVAYSLTKNQRLNVAERTDKFIEDPLLNMTSASNQDYAGSGFDKGHLAPALDMSWSLQSMRESFYLTNISPQAPAFNRGIWKKLETLVRSWAAEHDTIYIVTGPVLNRSSRSIGDNKVTVPELFYKVIISSSNNKIKGIGFLMPNKGSNAELKDFSVSIDSVETLTKIDFFPALSDAIEASVEKDLCISCWTWNSNSKLQQGTPQGPSTSETNTPPTKNASSTANRPAAKLNTAGAPTQCTGTTKSGARCKRMTTNNSGRCYQHD